MDSIVEEGGFANMDTFRESLPEELRNTEMIKNAKDMGSIAQMAVDNKTMVGQKVEEFIGSIPANGDDQTAMDTVRQKLGWPGVDGKYEVTRPEKVDGLDYSEEQEAVFLKVADKLRLGNYEVNSLIAMQHERQKVMLAENLKQATEVNEALKVEWGDQYETNKAEVNAILEKNGDESLVKLFSETELGSHAGFIKLLHGLGKGTLETGAVGKGDPLVNRVVAKEEAQKKISANYLDKEFMDVYSDTRHIDHKAKREEMFKLHEIVHGTATID